VCEIICETLNLCVRLYKNDSISNDNDDENNCNKDNIRVVIIIITIRQ